MFTHINTYHSYFEYLGVVDTEKNCPEGPAAKIWGGWSADSLQAVNSLGICLNVRESLHLRSHPSKCASIKDQQFWPNPGHSGRQSSFGFPGEI